MKNERSIIEKVEEITDEDVKKFLNVFYLFINEHI